MLDQIDFVSENWECFIYTYILNFSFSKYLIVDFSFICFYFEKQYFLCLHTVIINKKHNFHSLKKIIVCLYIIVFFMYFLNFLIHG